jgi:hypothetical protein
MAKMTLSAGSNSENDDHKATGRALEPSHGTGADSGLAPFLAAAGERNEQPAGPRPLHSRLLDYSAHAAMIVGLLGFAWTVSDHVAKAPDKPVPAKVMAVTTPPVDETAEMRRNTQKMAADISALRLSLDALRSQMHQDKTAEQVRSLASNLDGVKTGLTATKAETNATLAQLSSKIDQLPRSEATTKLQQVLERLEKIERQDADKTTTASIPPVAPLKPTPVALPPIKPIVAKATPALEIPDAAKKAALDKAVLEGDAAKKPPVIAEWVVRDVYDGVAVIESKRGPMEVVPGVTVPGAGVVKSIARHGAGWTVTTSKGLIAYLAAPRERQQHGYYRSMPEDF